MTARNAAPTKWTRAVKDRFIEAYQELGSAAAACHATGLSRMSMQYQRRVDPVFADDYRRAGLAAQERTLDDMYDAVHNGRTVTVTRPDGSTETRTEPASERIRAIAISISAKSVGAYQAAREADLEEDRAARRRVHMGVKELARSLGILL